MNKQAYLRLDNLFIYLSDRNINYTLHHHYLYLITIIKEFIVSIAFNCLFCFTGLIYFFKGTQFWTVDRQTFRIKSEQPRQISDYWLSCDVNPVS